MARASERSPISLLCLETVLSRCCLHFLDVDAFVCIASLQLRAGDIHNGDPALALTVGWSAGAWYDDTTTEEIETQRCVCRCLEGACEAHLRSSMHIYETRTQSISCNDVYTYPLGLRAWVLAPAYGCRIPTNHGHLL